MIVLLKDLKNEPFFKVTAGFVYQTSLKFIGRILVYKGGYINCYKFPFNVIVECRISPQELLEITKKFFEVKGENYFHNDQVYQLILSSSSKEFEYLDDEDITCFQTDQSQLKIAGETYE